VGLFKSLDWAEAAVENMWLEEVVKTALDYHRVPSIRNSLLHAT